MSSLGIASYEVQAYIVRIMKLLHLFREVSADCIGRYYAGAPNIQESYKDKLNELEGYKNYFENSGNEMVKTLYSMSGQNRSTTEALAGIEGRLVTTLGDKGANDIETYEQILENIKTVQKPKVKRAEEVKVLMQPLIDTVKENEPAYIKGKAWFEFEYVNGRKVKFYNKVYQDGDSYYYWKMPAQSLIKDPYFKGDVISSSENNYDLDSADLYNIYTRTSKEIKMLEVEKKRLEKELALADKEKNFIKKELEKIRIKKELDNKNEEIKRKKALLDASGVTRINIEDQTFCVWLVATIVYEHALKKYDRKINTYIKEVKDSNGKVVDRIELGANAAVKNLEGDTLSDSGSWKKIESAELANRIVNTIACPIVVGFRNVNEQGRSRGAGHVAILYPGYIPEENCFDEDNIRIYHTGRSDPKEDSISKGFQGRKPLKYFILRQDYQKFISYMQENK